MQFVPFPQANDVLKAAPSTEAYVRDLPIYRQRPFVVSCMEFDLEERTAASEAGRVFLQVVGDFSDNLDYLQLFAVLSDFLDCVSEEAPLYTDFEGTNAFFQLGSRQVPVFVQPLPGQQLPADSLPCAVLGFALTEGEATALMATGKLFVRAMGNTHPPIAMHATSPITFNAPVPEEAPTPLTDLSAQQN